MVALTIYSDLEYYPQMGDIYEKRETFTVSGKTIVTEEKGGHAVCIVGWGSVEDVMGRITKYWICKNSWGEDFGYNGYFFIRRGTNEVGIESQPVLLLLSDPPSRISDPELTMIERNKRLIILIIGIIAVLGPTLYIWAKITTLRERKKEQRLLKSKESI